MAQEAVQQPADPEATNTAKLLLEGVIHAVPGGGTAYSMDPFSAAEFNVELALLEAENERLREVARVLLLRQQQLEELAAKKEVRVASRVRPLPS